MKTRLWGRKKREYISVLEMNDAVHDQKDAEVLYECGGPSGASSSSPSKSELDDFGTKPGRKDRLF
jgi:hypothetical protein